MLPSWMPAYVQPAIMSASILSCVYIVCAFSVSVCRCGPLMRMRSTATSSFAQEIILCLAVSNTVYVLLWLLPLYTSAAAVCVPEATLAFGAGISSAAWAACYTFFTWRITGSKAVLGEEFTHKFRISAHCCCWGFAAVMVALVSALHRIVEGSTISSICWFVNDHYSTIVFWTVPTFVLAAANTFFAVVSRRRFFRVHASALSQHVIRPRNASDDKSIRFAQSLILVPILYIFEWIINASVDIPGSIGSVPPWWDIIANILGPLQGVGYFVVVLVQQRQSLLPCCVPAPDIREVEQGTVGSVNDAGGVRACVRNPLSRAVGPVAAVGTKKDSPDSMGNDESDGEGGGDGDDKSMPCAEHQASPSPEQVAPVDVLAADHAAAAHTA